MEKQVKWQKMGNCVYRQKFEDMSNVALQLMIQYAECGDDNSLPVIYDEDDVRIVSVRPDVAEMVRRMAYHVVAKHQHKSVATLRAVYEGRDWYIPAMRIWFSDVVAVALDIWKIGYTTAELFEKMDNHVFTDDDQLNIRMDIQCVAMCITNHTFVTPPVYYTPACLIAECEYDMAVWCAIYKVIVAGEVCGFLPKEMVWLTQKINRVCKAYRDGSVTAVSAGKSVEVWLNELLRFIKSQHRRHC